MPFAVVGGFQRGKSTLVNALVGRDVAEMGRGRSTTHKNKEYSLSSAVSVIDTPGFNANEDDDGTAASAIGVANVVVYVHESKALGDTHSDIFAKIRELGNRMIFLLNCCNFDKWSPDENDDIVSTVEAELETKGMLPSTIPLLGRHVFPLNVLWARFGLGMEVSSHDAKKIRMVAEEDLDLSVGDISEDMLRAEMLQRSGFLPVRDFLMNLPLEMLKHVAANPQHEIERVVDRFAEELKKRWAAA